MLFVGDHSVTCTGAEDKYQEVSADDVGICLTAIRYFVNSNLNLIQSGLMFLPINESLIGNFVHVLCIYL